MSEPVYDYYATRIVQDLEDDLYESKERIQRLRQQNDELAAENERLRDGIEVIRDRCAALAINAESAGIHSLAREMAINDKALTHLLNGDYE